MAMCKLEFPGFFEGRMLEMCVVVYAHPLSDLRGSAGNHEGSWHKDESILSWHRTWDPGEERVSFSFLRMDFLKFHMVILLDQLHFFC